MENGIGMDTTENYTVATAPEENSDEDPACKTEYSAVFPG